jgi:hypothetical protein
MLKPYLGILIFCLLASNQLKSQNIKIDSSYVKILRVDPAQAQGARISQIFDEVIFIPLETTKESLFGSISQLKSTTLNFVVWDNDTKSILIFNKDGKFKAKIKKSSIFNDFESGGVSSFANLTIMVEDGKEIIVAATNKSKIYFDLDAKLLRKVRYEVSAPTSTFVDGTIVDRNLRLDKDGDSISYELKLIKDNKNVASFFPHAADWYEKDQFFTAGEALTPHIGHDEYFFVRPYDYKVYSLTSKKMSVAYSFLFPASNSLPTGFESDSVFRGKRRDFFERNPKVFYGIGGINQIGSKLYFKVANWSWDLQEKKAFIYDLKTNLVTSIADLEPDAISQFLPITDTGVSNDFINRGFHLFDGKYFYTSYSSLAFFGFVQRNQSKALTYNSTISNFIKTQNKKSNPILIQLRPKKE